MHKMKEVEERRNNKLQGEKRQRMMFFNFVFVSGIST
jgi:hypothetical protein